MFDCPVSKVHLRAYIVTAQLNLNLNLNLNMSWELHDNW